jgi:RNA polymerase sigma-70 factor (ECF subfamily)
VEIIERVLAGEQDAFAVLVERYTDAVQRLAFRMLQNGPETEDVTQEVFLRAYTQLATYKPTHTFSTWLLSIAAHLAIDHLRRRRFLALPFDAVPFLEWIIDPCAGPEQEALDGEQRDELQTSLQRLPGKYRAVIVLRYWHDLSYAEIASVLHLPPPIVKARLHRGRVLLARSVTESKQRGNGEKRPIALCRKPVGKGAAPAPAYTRRRTSTSPGCLGTPNLDTSLVRFPVVLSG